MEWEKDMKKKLVLAARLSDLFKLDEYYELKDDSEKELETLRFILTGTPKENSFISYVVGLLLIESAQLTIIDGYPSCVLDKVRTLFQGMSYGFGFNNDFKKLIQYKKVRSKKDQDNKFIDLKANNPDTYIDLRETSIENLVNKRYPKLEDLRMKQYMEQQRQEAERKNNHEGTGVIEH